MPSRKARRMEARRRVGNRKPPVAQTDSRHPTYLIAHACFSCRKSFKLAPRSQAERPPPCPQCSKSLREMGRAFRAPPLRNKAQWRKLELLVAAGFRFDRYRGYGATSPPEKRTDAERFIRENPKHPLKRGGT